MASFTASLALIVVVCGIVCTSLEITPGISIDGTETAPDVSSTEAEADVTNQTSEATETSSDNDTETVTINTNCVKQIKNSNYKRLLPATVQCQAKKIDSLKAYTDDALDAKASEVISQVNRRTDDKIKMDIEEAKTSLNNAMKDAITQSEADTATTLDKGLKDLSSKTESSMEAKVSKSASNLREHIQTKVSTASEEITSYADKGIQKQRDLLTTYVDEKSSAMDASIRDQVTGQITKSLADSKVYTNEELSKSRGEANAFAQNLVADERNKIDAFVYGEVSGVKSTLIDHTKSAVTRLTDEIKTQRHEDILNSEDKMVSSIDNKYVQMKKDTQTSIATKMDAIEATMSEDMDAKVRQTAKEATDYTDSKVSDMQATMVTKTENQLKSVETSLTEGVNKKMSNFELSMGETMNTKMSGVSSGLREEINSKMATARAETDGKIKAELTETSKTLQAYTDQKAKHSNDYTNTQVTAEKERATDSLANKIIGLRTELKTHTKTEISLVGEKITERSNTVKAAITDETDAKIAKLQGIVVQSASAVKDSAQRYTANSISAMEADTAVDLRTLKNAITSETEGKLLDAKRVFQSAIGTTTGSLKLYAQTQATTVKNTVQADYNAKIVSAKNAAIAAAKANDGLVETRLNAAITSVRRRINDVKASSMIQCTALEEQEWLTYDNIDRNVKKITLSNAEGDSKYETCYASRAIDGEHYAQLYYWGKCYCYHSYRYTRAAFSWWQAKLPTRTAVTKVYILNRAECCYSRLSGVKAQVFDLYHPSHKYAKADQCYQLGSIWSGGWKKKSCTNGPRMGQYVRLALPRRENMQICEVEVYGYDAPLKTRHSSFTEFRLSSHMAVDGNVATYFSTDPNALGNQWWQVDFGLLYYMQQVAITNTRNSNYRWLNNFWVDMYLSFPSMCESSTRGPSRCGNYLGTVGYGNTAIIYCKGGIKGRFLRVVKAYKAGQSLAFTEIIFQKYV